MASDTPNFAKAKAGLLFTNYSHWASATLTEAQTEALVQGGVAASIAEATAVGVYRNDEEFSALFTESFGVGEKGHAKSETRVIGSFLVPEGETFKFHFEAALDLIAKEIEHPNTEYNKANSTVAFLLLNTSDVSHPKVLSYAGARGRLISPKGIASEGIAELKYGSGHDLKIHSKNKDIEHDGDNGTDYVRAAAEGAYERKFDRNTHLSLVEINRSVIEFYGDPLIGNLGKDFRYGTIWDDELDGTKGADKIYGSLGKDILRGKKGDDFLDGSQGEDQLWGGRGHDTLIGGPDNDCLVGSLGSDVMVGGDGHDKFGFRRGESLLNGEFDIIKDFEPSVDQIVVEGWDNVNPSNWFNKIVSQGQLTNTPDGALFTSNSGGELLFENINLSALSASDFTFR